MFPGATNSTSLSIIPDKAWFDLFMFSLYNIGDTAGRFIGGKQKYWISSNKLIIVAFSKVLFLISFIAIARNP